MQYSLQPGLTLKFGQRTLELVRDLDANEFVFEDTLHRRPSTLTREEIIDGVFKGKYTPLFGDRKHAVTGQKEQDQSAVFDLSSLTIREREVLDLRYEYVKALQKAKVSRGQRSKVASVISTIYARLASHKRPSTSTVMAWARNYQLSGNNPVALADRYRVQKREKRVSEKMESLLWKVLKRCYFTRDRYSIRHAHNQFQIETLRQKQNGEMDAHEEVISYPTLARRIQEVDLYQRVATREGSARARMVCRTAFPDGYPNYPLERVEIDHTPLNWVVICDRTGLPLGRPVLTTLIDAYSGYVLGFYLSFYGPGLTSVCGAVRSSLQPKESIVKTGNLMNPWLSNGLADEWVIDNGLEFHSFGFKQMAMSLGVDLMYCRVRTPWLKPRVERFFSTLNTITLMKGKIHKRVANVINADPYKDAAIAFGDLVTGLLQFFVDVHPFEPNWHKMARPFDLFKEGLERCPPAIYPGSLHELKLASGMSKLLTLGPGGIELMGLPYGSYGFKDIANRHGTRIKVLCKWDPDDLTQLFVQTPESGEWITAECRWRAYARGLSHNQHRLIRDFSRKELKSNGAIDYLLQAKQRLHEHWMDATSNRRRAEALQAGRYADFTSSCVSEPQLPPPLEASMPLIQASKIHLPQEVQWQEKDIPIFNSINF